MNQQTTANKLYIRTVPKQSHVKNNAVGATAELDYNGRDATACARPHSSTPHSTVA